MVKTRQDATRPGWIDLLAEVPAALRLTAAQFRPIVRPNPRGAPLMVIPALLAGDIFTRSLRSALNSAGFNAVGWGQGIDRGARPRKFLGALERIDELFLTGGQPLVLIGWSLGGLYARELAKRRSKQVALVLTLGTPFSHGLRRNNAWKLYEAVNDHEVDHPPIPADPSEKPRVCTIACWSSRDGIVAPLSAAGDDDEIDERIELRCRHNELVSDPRTIDIIVRRLDQWRGRTDPA